MLFATLEIVAVATLVRRPRLSHQLEQLVVFVARWLVQVELEVDHEVLVLQPLVLEQAQIGLLLLVDLVVRVVPHDALVETARRQSIRGDQVKHILVLQLAHRRLCVAQDVSRPRLVEEELFNSQDSTLPVHDIPIEALVTEANQIATSDKKQRLVDSAGPDYALTRFKFYRAHRLNDEPLVALLDALQEGSHGRVLEEEVSQLTVHLAVRDVAHHWILLHSVHVEVDRIHGVTGSDLHDFENLTKAKIKSQL